MRNALKWSALLVVALAVISVSVFAQTGGGLQGRVTDEAGQPIIGATIHVTGPKLQGFVGTATDTSGNYLIPFLPVGSGYQVKVEAPGYNTVVRKNIGIQLGTTISLPFTLSQGQTEVVVTAMAPILDQKTTQIGANITDKMIQSIPLPRNAAGIAFLAPSAVTSGLADTPSIGGASGPENSYTVDGVDVTGSGDALNNTSLNFDFIEATEVRTGGLSAEHGAVMGGNISSITKSGGNEFHGGLYAYYFDDGLGAKERQLNNPTQVNTRGSFKQYDVGGFLGGYFVKDKLWFFVAYDYNKTDTGFTSGGSGANVYINGRPATSGYMSTGYTNTDKNPMYAFKLTWNINPNQKLSLSVFGNNDTFDFYYAPGLSNPITTAAPHKEKTDNYAVNLQWNATWTPRFFTEVAVSRRHTTIDNVPTNASAMANYTYGYRYGPGTYTGYEIIPLSADPNSQYTGGTSVDITSYKPSLGGMLSEHTLDQNDQIRVKATNLFTFGGSHELSYGIQNYDIKYDYNFNYTGPSTPEMAPADPFFGRSPSGGSFIRWQYYANSPTQFLFRAQNFMNDQAKKTKQTWTGYWIQDNWNLTDYFMLKLGVRLDQLHMEGSNNNLNAPASIPGLLAAYGPGLANGKARSVNINDMWAPRVGFTWDVMHNNKSKLYGFWGWYYERIPNDMAIRALTDEYFHFSYYEDAGLTQPYQPNNDGYHYSYGFFNTLIQGGPQGQKLKGSYNEEWILGYEYEIRPDLTVGARAVYRSLGRVIEDISVDGANQYIITNPSNWTGIWVPDPYAFLGAPYDTYFYHFPKPVRIYKALEITMNKRFSNRWMMQGSYVLSRLQGNYEGLYSNDNGQLDPNITSKYDIPSLLINGYGLLPNDRTHVLKLYGGYFFENIPLELSANFQLQSGTPISALGADNAYGLNEGFAKVRGTAGRTPTTWALDIGAQYSFKLWKSNLALRADIFNITNEQRTTAVNETYNTENTQPHQNYPYFSMETAHQQARRIRLAIRWTF